MKMGLMGWIENGEDLLGKQKRALGALGLGLALLISFFAGSAYAEPIRACAPADRADCNTRAGCYAQQRSCGEGKVYWLCANAALARACSRNEYEGVSRVQYRGTVTRGNTQGSATTGSGGQAGGAQGNLDPDAVRAAIAAIRARLHTCSQNIPSCLQNTRIDPRIRAELEQAIQTVQLCLRDRRACPPDLVSAGQGVVTQAQEFLRRNPRVAAAVNRVVAEAERIIGEVQACAQGPVSRCGAQVLQRHVGRLEALLRQLSANPQLQARVQQALTQARALLQRLRQGVRQPRVGTGPGFGGAAADPNASGPAQGNQQAPVTPPAPAPVPPQPTRPSQPVRTEIQRPVPNVSGQNETAAQCWAVVGPQKDRCIRENMSGGGWTAMRNQAAVSSGPQWIRDAIANSTSCAQVARNCHIQAIREAVANGSYMGVDVPSCVGQICARADNWRNPYP
jgi:hypothetical protein